MYKIYGRCYHVSNLFFMTLCIWNSLFVNIANNDYNGIVTAFYTVMGGIAAYYASDMSRSTSLPIPSMSPMKKFIFLQIIVCSCFVIISWGQVLLSPGYILLAYIFYTLYGGLHYAMMTNVSAELALHCTTNQYAKMFSIVALLAATVETGITFILQSASASTHTWFGAIGFLHVALLVFSLYIFRQPIISPAVYHPHPTEKSPLARRSPGSTSSRKGVHV